MKTGCSTYRVPILAMLLWAILGAEPAFAVRCDTLRYRGSDYDVCRVDTKSENLGLYYLAPTGDRFRTLNGLQSALKRQGHRLIFATNAGIFTTSYRPLGLYIENGVELVPMSTSDGEGNFFLKPNGIFAVTDSGPIVVETSELRDMRSKLKIATQSGPLLLRNGSIHPAFNNQSTNKTVRSGVGVEGSLAIFVLSESDVSFYDIAALFRDELHCKDALYLDGAISEMLSPRSAAPGGHEFAAMFGVVEDSAVAKEPKGE
ncbi:MAG: phosphodiester glycosidase family protein [Bdellovibrionota bacterium]